MDGTFRPATYLSAPSRRGTLEAVHCGPEWIPVETVSEPGSSLLGTLASELIGAKRRPEVRRLTPEIAYARVPEMNPGVYAHVDKDRPSWPKPTGHERALIIDLRGNGGGDAGFGQSVIADWVDVKRLPEFEQFSMHLGTSCLYAPLKWGFLRMFLGMGAHDADSRANLQEMLDRISQPSPPDCPRQVQVSSGKVAFRDHRMQPAKGLRLIALVDNGCGSDCEFLVGQLATLPETVVVGVNTLGVAQFIQPGYGVLPHTGLPFRIALGRSDVYGDGRSFDGYGYDVDVLLPHPEKWDDEALVKLTQALLAR
jgi:C-terminal processing protease CtpA/Prc